MVTRAGLAARLAAERAWRASRLKQALVALMLAGALGSLTVPGVYGIFSADTQNLTSTAASGTLTLSTTVGTGTACLSYGGPPSPGNASTSCDALFSYSPAGEHYPGDPASTAAVTIENGGSLDASDLSLSMPGGCSSAATPDAPSPGGGNPCGTDGLRFYVQETASDGTPTTCWFPVVQPGACPLTDGTLAAFAAGSGVDLGPGPQAQQTRYFSVGLQVPNESGNPNNDKLQGEEATFAVAWHMTS
jgi:hypothetical protein